MNLDDRSTRHGLSEGWLFRCRTDDLADLARMFINFRCRFMVLKPVELKMALRELAREIEAIAENTNLLPYPN